MKLTEFKKLGYQVKAHYDYTVFYDADLKLDNLDKAFEDADAEFLNVEKAYRSFNYDSIEFEVINPNGEVIESTLYGISHLKNFITEL